VKVGQTQFADVVVTVSNTSGPFNVTSPNTAVTWAGGSTQTITWNVANTTLSPVSCAKVKISLSTDGGQTFPVVLIDSTANDGSEPLVIPNTATTTARIKVEAVRNIFFDISNTNFSITASATCASPTGLNASLIGNDTATISWNAVTGAVSYAVEYKVNSSSTWTIWNAAFAGRSAKLTGLTQGTLYDWRIKTNCSGSSSSYSTAQFTTTAPFVCNPPVGLNVTNITSSAATLNWTIVNGAVSYFVDYKLTTDTVWTNLSSSVTTSSISITGLSANTTYDYRVGTKCFDSTSSGFVAAQFTTAPPFVCNAPANLSAASITSSGATLSWSAVSGASSYRVEYKLITDSVWSVFSASQSGTSSVLTGLTASTSYNFRVMTNCNDSSNSSFASAQFTTAAPFVCNAPANLVSSNVTSTGATISWSAVNGAASYTVEYKLSTALNWIILSSAQAGTSAVLSGLTASSIYNYRVRTNCTDGSNSSYASSQFTTSALNPCVNAFEPNESITAAAAVTSGVNNSAAISSALDVDFFKITTTATSNMSYVMTGPSGVDLDITVYNSAGTQIGSGATASSSESVSLTNQAAGTYYVKVFGYNGVFSSSCYTINITATTVTSCQSTKDTSTNNTTAGAATIPFNTNILGRIDVSNDVDHYRFTITTGGSITLTLTTLPANYNLRLVNSAGTILATSQKSNTTNESITYTVTPGTYFARVYASSSTIFNASSCYTLKVALGTATKSSNQQSSTNGLPFVSVFPNPVRDLVNVRLTGAEGMDEIKLFNTNGTCVLTQKLNSDNLQMDLSKLSAGVYMIRVSRNNKVIAKTKFVKQ
jgi:hypothetical protein